MERCGIQEVSGRDEEGADAGLQPLLRVAGFLTLL